MNLVDVYILPSFIEAVPISILEAESYHKPIIVTNVGAILFIVKDHETGLYITLGNSEEILGQWLIMILSDINMVKLVTKSVKTICKIQLKKN